MGFKTARTMIVHGAPKPLKLKKCVKKVKDGGLGIVVGCTRSNGLARGFTVRALEALRQFAKARQRCNNRIPTSKFPNLEKGQSLRGTRAEGTNSAHS